MTSQMSQLTPDTLQTTLSGNLVLLDFWAHWCAPCRTLSPHLERLAEHYEDRLKVAKIDIEAYPELGDRFAARGIPCWF
ncbi:thioredoxin 1 [Pseudomonas flavescens]|uniref:Thioredoxin 1 n=1 Tax=Phytopseudomonas flavescens TaxID=29435 RepID=A0A1G8GN90_9GAMM|nr:thioredoxin domain-containing protein [Pseudomonas flavescens]SDH95842.1 thioredoxin 1 [Pseudomonas flavescens]